MGKVLIRGEKATRLGKNSSREAPFNDTFLQVIGVGALRHSIRKGGEEIVTKKSRDALSKRKAYRKMVKMKTKM